MNKCFTMGCQEQVTHTCYINDWDLVDVCRKHAAQLAGDFRVYPQVPATVYDYAPPRREE